MAVALMPRARNTRPVPGGPRPTGLGLTPRELEELITAAHDRDELIVDPNRRARLRHGRLALERELARTLAD